MSTSSYKPGQPNFTSDGASADAILKEYIEAPFAAAQQPALSTGLQLLAFISALPEAFITSEKRELKRLAKTADSKNDTRIERLQLSIERAAELHRSASQGKTRIDRAILALSTEDNIFHGFVSDSELKPLAKMTVRISAFRAGDTSGSKETKSLSASTDADGYFSISLGKEKPITRKPVMSESKVKLSEQMAERLASVNAKAKASTTTASGNAAETYTANTIEVLAQVEILDGNQNIIHKDETPLVMNAGTAYREYLIGDDASGKLQSSDKKTTAPSDTEKNSSARTTVTSTAKPDDASTKTQQTEKSKDSGKPKK